MYLYFTVSAVTSQVVEVVFKQLEGKKGGETGEGKGVNGGGINNNLSTDMETMWSVCVFNHPATWIKL